MTDFDFFTQGAQGNDSETRTPPATDTDAVADRVAKNDFDFFSSIGSTPKDAGRDYGVMDRQRDTVVAETGDASTDRGTAFLQNILPGALNEAKKERDFQLSNLERLRSGSAMKEIEQRRKEGRSGTVERHRNEGRLRHGIAGEISDIGAGGTAETQEGIEQLREAGKGSAWEGFKKGIKDILGDRKPQQPTHEEREASYFDQLESVAKNAGIDEKRIGELRDSSKTVEDFEAGLREEAVKSLTSMTKTRKEASERLQKFKADKTDSILNGLITNTGYTGGFMLASATGPMGYAALIGDTAEQRAKELTQKDYDIGPDGSLIVINNDESKGAAAVKGLAGATAEVAVEVALEKGLGWIFGGMKVPLGKGKSKVLAPWLGKASGAVESVAKKPVRALGRAMSKNPVGKWLVGAAENFGKYSEITGVQGLPMEMLEEHVQSFADDVLGLGTKSRDYKGVGAETSDWWNKKFWNYESNRDLFLGLVGTMAVQGTYAGTKAHHDIAKWRQDKAGFLKTVIDPKKVDALSDDEVRHLYDFVSSKNFTKDRVERFLGHVKDRSEMTDALLQLKEANMPFFETDKEALQKAVESGSVKSKFEPPTREATGGREIDWQPYTWKDGRRTMRVYDPNTGIAIDQMGGMNNHLVVTNRDGVRIEVGADESGDAFQKAMKVADTMSINNQLLDMKRPMKQAYVESRIEALFPKGDFDILANNAELVEKYKGIEKTKDYSPKNPAFTTNDGRVVIVLDNLKNAYEANRMILHEAAIHSGLKEKFTPKEKRDFLRNIDDPKVNAFNERLMKLRGVESVDDLSDADVEEAFAHTWDRRRTNPLLTQKVGHALREMGRKVGLPISYNTSDLEVMVDELQREGKNGRGEVSSSSFDTTEHANSVPYNEAQRDFSGDVADTSKPAEETDEKKAVREMERIDRIKENHPRMWEYAMRVNDGDEDAAAAFVADALEDEGRRGVAGEAEYGMHALEVAAKLENGEDLTPADIEILDDHGFTGPILYTDYGYRKQKNGSWRHVETTTKQEKPNETGNRANEAPAQPEQGAERQAEPEVPRPAEAGATGAQNGAVVSEARGAEAANQDKVPQTGGDFLRIMHDDGELRRVPLNVIKMPDTQFKEDADPNTGVVKGQELHGEYYESAENAIALYERLNGDIELVTGRHRKKLAEDNGKKDILARVFREADGIKPSDMLTLDAVSNIIDEKGTEKDYVNYFDKAKPSRAAAEAGGFLSRPKGRLAFGIYADATEDTRASIDWKGSGADGMISAEQAGIIAEAAPKGEHPRAEAVQRVLVKKALSGVRGKKLGILARAVAEEARTAKAVIPDAGGEMQLDLFTSEEDQALLAMEERRADYRAKKANEYGKIAEDLRTSLRKGGRLDLNADYAKELGITDPKDRAQIAAARDKAVERANYWENAVRLDDADKAAMDAELGIETKPKQPAAGAAAAKPAEAAAPAAAQTDDAKMERAKAAAEKHVVRYGNGMQGTLADMIKSGAATLYPDKGLYVFDKGKPNVVTIGFEQFTPTKDELPYLIQVQREYFESHPEMIDDNVRKWFPGLKESSEKQKPVALSEESITNAIDVDRRDGLIRVYADSRYGEGVFEVKYARGSEEEIKGAADDLRKAFPGATVYTGENSIVVAPQKKAEKSPVSAPKEEGATTLPKATEAPEAKKSGTTAKPAADTDIIDLSDNLGDINAMWFNRELEDQSESDFAIVDISKAPFNNVDAAVAWAEQNGIVGKMTDAETGGKGEIDISKNSIREMLNPTQVSKSTSKDAHFAVVTKLRDILRESHIEESHPDYKKGKDGKRSAANGINPGVTIDVAYAAVNYDGTPMRAKITLKKYSDKNTPTRAYAYHVMQIEVLTGNLANPASGTGPHANTSIRRDIILNGVLDVNGAPLLRQKQGELSGGTSLNQNPAGNNYGKKWGIFRKGTRNIDIGAGRFDKATQFLADLGVTNIPFDPVNRDSETNRRSAEDVRANPADTATVHNVLNVIDNDAVVDGIINQAARGIKKNGTAIFTIYEGDKSGEGKVTTRGYQRNERTSAYVPRLQKYFGHVETHGNVILATQPKDVGPAFWAFDSSFDNGIRWMSRELEEHTDEEREAHNLMLGVKIVKSFAAKGGKDFGQFTRSVKAIAPEVYGRIRNQLPGMWLTAWMGGAKSLVMPKTEEFESILGATDAWNAPEKPKSTDQKPQEREEAPKTNEDTPKHATRGEAISAAADEIVALIDGSSEKFTRQDVEKIVGKHLGGSVAEGTFEMKDVTDILELAVNRIIRTSSFTDEDDLYYTPDGDVGAATDKIRALRDLLAIIPTQTTRSAEQDKMQQFSTVPTEAFAAAWVANITDKDVMLEPSAGIGGIAVFAKNAGAEVILNELSPRRREILEQLGLSDKVHGVNAEYLWAQFYAPIKSGKMHRPTVVVMNPPFSNSALTSKKDTVGIGGKHIEQALEMLAPGGRLVAIVGHGMAHDADSPKVKAWWSKIGKQYRVRADVAVNGNEYAKYGTTHDNNMIVIDKLPPDDSIAPIYGKIQSLDELPRLLEGVRNDRPAVQSGNVASKPDNGGPSARPSGGAVSRPQNDNRGGSQRPANNGRGSAKPAGKPAGRTGGGVSDTRENGGRGAGASPVLGVDATVPGGLTKVESGAPAAPEANAPREVGNGTFSTYRPAKVNIEGAKPHPTALVESTAMASVLPPDPTYSPILPKKAIESGMPSDAQLEQIVYAGQAHEQMLPNGQRRGYFFGDGTGLGKGTEIGGVISDNWNHGRRKAVWVSKESGLLQDAMRDLVTYGLDGQIFDFNPKKKSVTSRDTGIAFMSYDGLRSDCVFDTEGKVRSSKQGQKNRFQHLVEWLGKDFDGVIVFDEAHKAGNAVATRGKRGTKQPSKQALAVVALQEALPNARILYVSATGATEVSNLSYATRLGLWGRGTAFRDRMDFINRVSSGGLSVMEIVARDMKSMGVYMARSLSYDGIVNRKLEHALSPDQKRKYDEMADAWQMVISSVGEALIATNGAGNSQAVSAAMSALWGGEQRFFNQLLTAMQMPSIIADAKKQLEAGNSVVFQIVNTNEATQKRAIEAQKLHDGEVNAEELDLSPRDIIIGYVRNSFPTTQYVEQEDEDGNTQYVIQTDADGNPVENPIAVEARDSLIERLNMMKLDDNPLELIIDEFGADNVAEVTGRSQRRQMVRNEDGEMETKLVSRSKKVGLIETDEFNAGKRRVLVFSDAGGTGRSFHADKRFGNQQKRVHYLVQAGWRADAALQGFGRTHRSNEAQPPEYVLCSTDIRGHQRFISTVARRLAQLGSLTAGDRSSAGSGVFSEDDNLENQYAQSALHALFNEKFSTDRGRFTDICRQLGFVKMKLNRTTGETEEVNQLLDKDGDLDLTRLTIPTFLNRILNMRVDEQNKLFDEFQDIMRDHIDAAKEAGTFDPGLEKLQGDKIEELNRTELWSGGKGTGSTDIVEVGVSKKSRKVDFETVLERMKRQADGRGWYFARNLNSGKIFGFAETAKAKTLQSGLVVNQLRCYSPDGSAPLVHESDVRFDGPRVNFEKLSERAAVGLWNDALAAMPDLDTTKRYFVHGTMLPIWDRLAVQNPRIYRIAPEGKGSFLGMEVKAENVNDILRRFGKAAQSVELTPDVVLNRIVKDGKKVPLIKDGWELKRSRVNGDYRIELVGPEERRELEKMALDGLGTMERIGYVPRFFIPRSVEGLTKFLEAYPAMPEDGGIGTVASAGVDYTAMSIEERQRAFANLLQRYINANERSGSSQAIADAADALDNIIAAMPTEELMRVAEDYQQYDSSHTSPVHKMRQMVRQELQNRGAINENQITDLGMWFSRDLDELADDALSSVAIHEVNAWRAARGLPEMPKSAKTTVDDIINAGKYMASNADEMERFLKVSAETPHNWTAVEVAAVAQRRLALENDYDEKTRLINVAEMNGNKEEAQRIREARDLVQDQIDVMDRAINKAKREWGLSGLARRFMLNRDGTFARFSGELQSIAGRKLTEEEEQGAQTLWNAYRDAQGKLDEATVEKTAELLKDIVRKHMAREEQQHRMSGGKQLNAIEKEYQQALDHILVHANRAGGVLMGLPDGRKWIDALRRYHMAAAIETGRHLDVNEMLEKIHADIDGMVVADDHDIMQIITGHGNTYEADNSELEKALREQRRLMNEYQKWEDMLTEGHLPDKTGLIRDEPTQTEREAQRQTRELMREFMQAHPEFLQMDAAKRLKTIQDSLMKRWQNEINDLRKAVENDERIMRQKNTMTYTPEMVERRKELEEWRQRYREAFPPEPLTHEQKVAKMLRALQGRLAKLEEKRNALEGASTDAEREAVLAKRKTEDVKDPQLKAIRQQIKDVQAEIQDLHDLHFPAGTTEEFVAALNTRKKALGESIDRIQALLLNRDFAPQKREPSALAKRVAADPGVQELVKNRNAAAKRLMQERERYRRSVLPYNAGKALDWFSMLTSAPRVLRTMLDLSATMTQGAVLFESHPVMGFRALADSVKAFYSADNTDAIMAALAADPDFTEFQEMGGRVFNVSNLTERGLPEEFRGIALKPLKINGKEYGLEDIPGVKASERSFGVFLNSINLSVYKAIKASGGWGPTGPSESQKKDIALSLNVASGYGYTDKGGRGTWDRIASAALWAPRFAAAGAKMAIGWNIFAPHWTGLTTERTYKDRMTSSKVAAQQYVRQITSMAAWTLLATLLMGRKDPEWLEEVLDPRSSNFLNVRVGNTNVNFFGPVKQWWTFMARMLSGQTRGADSVVRNRDRMQTAIRFARGKLSPLAGLGMDLLEQKTFLGDKLVWGRAAGVKETSGWMHVASSLGIPLSMGDLASAFKENTLACALMLTPFILAGAAKSTYQLNEYDRTVNPYKAAARELKQAWKDKRYDDMSRIKAENPALNQAGRIDSLLKTVDYTRKWISDLEKAGKTPSDDLLRKFQVQQQAVVDAINGAKKPVDKGR